MENFIYDFLHGFGYACVILIIIACFILSLYLSCAVHPAWFCGYMITGPILYAICQMEE